MTVVSSYGVGFVDKDNVGKDNVGKDELGPTHSALVIPVGLNRQPEKPHWDRFRWNLKITTVLISSPARFDLIVTVGLRLRA